MVFDLTTDAQSVGEQTASATESEPCGRKADCSVCWSRDVERIGSGHDRLSR